MRVEDGVRIKQRDPSVHGHHAQVVALTEVQKVLPHRVHGQVIVARLVGRRGGWHHVRLRDERD
jgi:hypothetical protein